MATSTRKTPTTALPALRLNVNIGDFFFERGGFHPTSGLQVIGRRETLQRNPRRLYGRGAYAGLLIVGLTAKDRRRTFTSDDAVRLTTAFLRANRFASGASFIYQRGIYFHRSGGEPVQEESVRVIILNLDGTEESVFRTQIFALGEQLLRQLDQEEVILEFQRGGIGEEVWGLT